MTGMKAFVRRMLAITLLGAAAASPALAQDWGQVATISSTLGVNAGRLCVGEGTRSDIGCPTYAPSVSTGGLLTATALSATTLNGNYASFTTLSAGNVSFTGNLSIEGVTFANGGIELEGSITGDTVTATTVNGHYASFTTLTAGAFNGDGSGLTGVTAASTDRITSGTNSIFANTGMNTLSFTTAGTDRMVINSSGNVGIGTTTPTQVFAVGGASGFNVNIIGDVNARTLQLNGGGITNATVLNRSSGSPLSIQTGNYTGAGNNIQMSTGTASNSSGQFNAVVIAPTYNQTGTAAGTDLLVYRTETAVGSGAHRLFDTQVNGITRFTVLNSGNVGVGIATPTATLQVSGSFTVSSTGQTTSPSLYVGTNGNVGIGTVPSYPLHINSASSGNSVGLSVNGSARVGLGPVTGGGYGGIELGAGQGLVWGNSTALGGTKDVGISRGVTNTLYVNTTSYNGSGTLVAGNIGVNTITPSTPLEVNGTISATSLYVTATTGTISGTAVNGRYASFTTLTAGTFYGDGSGLTGVTAASSDRITSGTTNVVANGNSGYVSFTSAGTTTGYYSPGGIFAAVGISTSSNQASFTTVYASGNVGIGGTTSAVNNNPLYVTSPYDVTNFMVEATGISGNSAFELLAPLSTTTANGKAFSIRVNSETYARGLFYTDGSIGMGPGTSTRDVFLSRSGANTLRISSDRNTGSGNLQVTGRVAVATTAPSATAHVSGTFMVAGGTGSETCDNTYLGLMRRNPATGRLQTCR